VPHHQHILALDARFLNYKRFFVNRFKDEKKTDAELSGMGLVQGFNEATADYFDIWYDKAREHLVIAQRDGLEHAPQFRQILPYTVIAQNPVRGTDFSQDVFTVYQRTKQVGESRLAGNFSIGGGGHIDIADLIFDTTTSIVDLKQTILRALFRELIEEFIFIDEHGVEVTPERLVGAITFVPAGFIRDDANTVGQVHLGVVNVVYVPHTWTVKVRPPKEGEEAEHLDAPSGTAAEILSRGAKFENWSQILLEEFAQVGRMVSATAKPANPNTVIALTDANDTLDSLVAQFGVSKEELLRLNPVLQQAVANGGQCENGWRLWITDPDATFEPEVKDATPVERVIAVPTAVTVQPGETFGQICARFGLDRSLVARLNDLSTFDDIIDVRVGQRLYLTVPKQIQLRPGDTLEKICERFGLAINVIRVINRFAPNETMIPGRMVTLQADESAIS
jgi:predicted NUDIX family phosphoesterase